MRRRVAAPTALAHDDGREVQVERLAHAGLDAAIGRAAADDDGIAPEHMQQLRDAGAQNALGRRLRKT